MSNRASFHIIYDGPALQDNEMDVRDLAPSLLALSDLFDEANHILNHGQSKIAINIKASFKTGCFGVELSIVQDMLSNIANLFKEDSVLNAATIATLTGFTATGATKTLIGFIKWLKSRKIKQVELLNNGLVRVVLDDDYIEIEKRVLDLYRNSKIRKALEAAITKPLEKDGIDSFACTEGMPSENMPFFSITKKERDCFIISEPADEILEELEYEAHLQALSIAFQEDNKWRFTDGTNKFYAEVKDIAFLHKIQNNDIAFRKDDLLKVLLLMKQRLTGSGLKSEYQILNVLEHRSAARQLELPLV
ncbi:MAG: hypothetical protein HQK66_11800 [Desulfamplus sp.]|nr:hypothetical protein [Desulfamplus sp.]